MCCKMPPSQYSNRINLQDLKAKIAKKLGPGRASQYFQILGQFFSCKLSKAELDRHILSTVGKEYISLHNQLIWSIWANVTLNGATPSTLDKSQKANLLQKKSPPITVTDHESSPQVSQSPIQAAFPNGYVVTASPRKGRTSKGDRKTKDKQTIPNINSKAEVSVSREAVRYEGRGKCLEDGVSEAADLTRRLEDVQDPAQQLQSEQSSPMVPTAKRARLALSNGMSSLQVEGANKQNSNSHPESLEKAIKDESSCLWAKRLITAPLGIPFCVGSIGAAVKIPVVDKPLAVNYNLLGDKVEEDCSSFADLPDAGSLQRRMEHIAVLEGDLEGVSHEAAVCLNLAVDVYLKRLIAACTEFVQSRRPRDEQGNASFREEAKRNASLSAPRPSPSFNKIQSTHLSSDSAAVPLEAAEEMENHNSPITPMDFKVVMENKPQQLGENWPVLLERLSFRVFEQQDKQYLSGI